MSAAFLRFGHLFLNPEHIAVVRGEPDERGDVQRLTVQMVDGSRIEFATEEAQHALAVLEPLLAGR